MCNTRLSGKHRFFDIVIIHSVKYNIILVVSPPDMLPGRGILMKFDDVEINNCKQLFPIITNMPDIDNIFCLLVK